jgi:hypothetical protein
MPVCEKDKAAFQERGIRSVKFGSKLDEWYPRAPVWTVAGRRPRRLDFLVTLRGREGGREGEELRAAKSITRYMEIIAISLKQTRVVFFLLGTDTAVNLV